MTKSEEIAKEIFYKPATNGKAEKSIKEGAELIDKHVQEQLQLHIVVNCVYVVTERDNYGEQLFKQVFASREKAVEYLAKQGLKEGNVDEITEIELN